MNKGKRKEVVVEEESENTKREIKNKRDINNSSNISSKEDINNKRDILYNL